MKSQANVETRLDCELNSARSTASRHAVTVLLIFTVGGGFVVEVLGAHRAEATPLTAIVEVPQMPASAARLRSRGSAGRAGSFGAPSDGHRGISAGTRRSRHSRR